MTEAEWLACTDPKPMLKFLRGRASERKLRLFAVACCRRIQHVYSDEGRGALERTEELADGLIGRKEWLARVGITHIGVDAAVACANQALLSFQLPLDAVSGAARAAGLWSAYAAGTEAAWGAPRAAVEAAERVLQADLLRDIVGSPLRAQRIDPAWLRWNDGTAARLAQDIYSGRRFGDLPVLADALEDAGCTDEWVLGHCRRRGEHVRGCWVIDLLTGRG
jgi:hypothetical protein